MFLELARFEQLKATGDLPSPKGVALSIIRLIQRDDVSGLELEQVIKTDPAFVGRLIRAANMASRHNGRPVVSVQDALQVLGMSIVRNLALSFSLVSDYRTGACHNFDYGRFWSLSLLCALALREIVGPAGLASSEEAFCCGLLSRVGQLALVTLYPEQYSKLLEKLQAAGSFDEATLRERESAAFALHNGDLTAAMLEDWGFPQVFNEPLYFHHQPQASRFEPGSRGYRLMLALSLAEGIAELCLGTEVERPARFDRLYAKAAHLGLEPPELRALCDRAALQWREWGSLLEIRSASLQSFAAEAAEAGKAVGEGSDALLDKVFSPLRVLLAGGEPDARTVLSGLLRQAGHQVLLATDGDGALELALDVHPQLVLVHWSLPGLSAAALIRTLRETRQGRGLYLLVLVEREDEEAVVAAFEAGADDCLCLPLSERLLLARLLAGQRVVRMQQEIERDREEIRHLAAEMAATNRRLKEAALTDVLTGFHNRRYAMDRLEQEWESSRRSGRLLSCMVIDLDDFKQVNDTYGHDMGDVMLGAVSRALRENLRANDVICRIGGDEFLVISPDTDAEALRACAERLVAAVARLRVAGPGAAELRGSVSIGLATRDGAMENPAILVKAADEGMYRAKLAGRGRVGLRDAP